MLPLQLLPTQPLQLLPIQPLLLLPTQPLQLLLTQPLLLFIQPPLLSLMGSGMPLCMQRLLLSCTPRLPRQLLWRFTTTTHLQLLPIPLLLLPTPPLLLLPQRTTTSPSHMPPMQSPTELEAALTVRFTPTRSSLTVTSTPSPTPRRTTTSTQSSPVTGLGCEVDPTLSPCQTHGSSTWCTPRTPTATSPLSPTRVRPSSPTLSELWTGIT